MKRTGTRAFTLIETIIAFSILLTSMAVFGLVQVSNARASGDLKRRDIAFARGQAIMERILRLPFGTTNPPAPSGSDLDRLFGSNEDVRTLSLTQLLQRDMNGDGVKDPIRFRLEGVEDSGVWAIAIDSDLDGDGTIDDQDGDGLVDGDQSLTPTQEGRDDLVRIEIFHNGRTILKTLRTRTPQDRDASEALN